MVRRLTNSATITVNESAPSQVKFDAEDFPFIDFDEISEPASPSAGSVRAYASAFGRLNYKDSGGVLHYLTQDAVNVLNFGADRTGGSDISAAMQLAIDSVGANDIALYFPAGQYALSGSDSTLAFADKNVVIFGDGKGVSRILCRHANAKVSFSDSYNGQDDLLVKRFNMRGLSLVKDLTTSSGLGGDAVTMTWGYTGVASTVDHASFDHVNISSHSFTKFWHKALKIIDGGCIRITSCNFYQEAINTNSGPCIEIVRSAASNITSYNIVNSIIANWNTAFTFTHESASQNGTIEGLYIANCEIFGVQLVFNDDNDSNVNHQINAVTVVNSHLNASSRLAFWGWISGFHVTGCDVGLNDTGGDPSPGGEDFLVCVLKLQNWNLIGNRCFRNAAVGAATFLLVPGDPNTLGLVVIGNDFENWTNVAALISGTATRTQSVAIFGSNRLISSGGYGSIGISTDEQNDTLGFTRDYATGLRSTTAGIRSSHATAGIGQATGAGGAVTQATDKSTGVTLNKICGQITTSNAILNAAARVGFTVTNSAVAATDTVDMNLASGGSTNAYRIEVDNIQAGNFHVCIHNISGSNLSEALVLNFGINKRVAA